MILATCADKRAPGASTLAMALAAVWPGERVLLEADTSGGDLALRLVDMRGLPLVAEQTVLSLAVDAREGLASGALTRYAQHSSLGCPVLLGPLSAEGFEPMARLWPQVAAEAQRWPGTVVADLGRLQLRHAAGAVAAQASGVLLVTRATTAEDLYHCRDRAAELASRLGRGPHGRSPLAVVVVAAWKQGHRAVELVQQALSSDAMTSTIPVAGFLAEDTRGVTGLRAGDRPRRWAHSDLLRSARSLAQTVLGWWPELNPAGVGTPADGTVTVDGPSGAAAVLASRQPAADATGDQGWSR